MDPKYPNVFVQLTGQDGNAFAIMGAVADGLRRELRDPSYEMSADEVRAEIDAYKAESMSGDYDNLLRVAMSWVDVG